MPIILVSSAPIEALKDYEIKTGEEDTEKIAHVYGPARRYEPTTRAYPRRYEPTPIAPVQRTKKHLYLVAGQRKEEI